MLTEEVDIRSHNIQYYSHNPGVRGRLSSLSFYFYTVDKNVHEYDRVGYSSRGDDRDCISCDDGDDMWDISGNDCEYSGDIIVDDGRRGSRSQYYSHS